VEVMVRGLGLAWRRQCRGGGCGWMSARIPLCRAPRLPENMHGCLPEGISVVFQWRRTAFWFRGVT
jgi:hypothetical protein